ncbi:uncharacterized protein LOC123262834 [Cotesia glomerata]|uniref:uncharacterized protein LOC123262834 n=1 Tax=Cotesia glomerata TaxID=32391 RepID=UPI001D02626D|nr:uncharacterized protein LOC123262834 [Cotesia glomerata]
MTSYGVEGQETERLPEEDFGAYCKRLARRVSDQQVDWLLDKWRSMNYGRLVIKGEECIRFPAYNSFKMEDWIARRVLEAAEEQVHGLGALKEVPCRLGCLNVETAYHVISACGRQTHLTRHDTAVSSIKFPAFNSFKMEDWIARRTLKAAEEQVHGLGSITGAPCWLECQNTETAYHVIGACGMQTHPARHDSAVSWIIRTILEATRAPEDEKLSAFKSRASFDAEYLWEEHKVEICAEPSVKKYSSKFFILI